MTELFGVTRTRVAARHALITPDGHVVSVLPGAEGVRVFFHITRGMGANLTQAGLEFDAGGRLPWPVAPGYERFVYVRSGRLVVDGGAGRVTLGAGGYAFFPADAPCLMESPDGASVALFEKKYEPLPGVPVPEFLHGDANAMEGEAYMGNPKARLKTLLPDDVKFDMAVNIFTYQPGATLPFVETHIMEHGMLMLAGQGVYRLEDSWYPVREGDVIWMAPYCPQWFVAMGDEPASYIYYKDVSRHPVLE